MISTGRRRVRRIVNAERRIARRKQLRARIYGSNFWPEMNFRRRRRDISVDSSNKILAAPSGRHFRAFLELTRAHLGGKKANEYRAMSKDMHNLIQLLVIVLI